MKPVGECWSKGLESQIINLNGKLSALCLQVKELQKLLLGDQTSMGSPKFESDKLELHMREVLIVEANQTSMGSPKFESEGLELQMKKAPTIEAIAKRSIHVLGTILPS